jgi:hypothetical protein
VRWVVEWLSPSTGDGRCVPSVLEHDVEADELSARELVSAMGRFLAEEIDGVGGLR